MQNDTPNRPPIPSRLWRGVVALAVAGLLSASSVLAACRVDGDEGGDQAEATAEKAEEQTSSPSTAVETPTPAAQPGSSSNAGSGGGSSGGSSSAAATAPSPVNGSASPGQTATIAGNSASTPANASAASPSPTNSPTAPAATATKTATPKPTAAPTKAPTKAPTATKTPTKTATKTPTATYTPTKTATATPTPTYTPTQAVPVAPPDANFNSPLAIPLDSTTSVTDFVSYPGGDTTDRVRYEVTGMNPNSALSGGRARLIISASCFGTGTQNLTFSTGGETFTCGQTLVDREVTADSDTGTITIVAEGGTGTYVQWVLTGSAARLN